MTFTEDGIMLCCDAVVPVTFHCSGLVVKATWHCPFCGDIALQDVGILDGSKVAKVTRVKGKIR
jgi:hypothetical protein